MLHALLIAYIFMDYINSILWVASVM